MEKIPDELSAALAKDVAAKNAFAAMPPSHQREYAVWVDGAKRPETRLARAQKALTMIAKGQP
jgi:uncharacterized protein YdeI (YjbR/CyaY-like superfamily)